VSVPSYYNRQNVCLINPWWFYSRQEKGLLVSLAALK